MNYVFFDFVFCAGRLYMFLEMFVCPAEGGDNSGASRNSGGAHSLHHCLLLLDQKSKVRISSLPYCAPLADSTPKDFI